MQLGLDLIGSAGTIIDDLGYRDSLDHSSDVLQLIREVAELLDWADSNSALRDSVVALVFAGISTASTYLVYLAIEKLVGGGLRNGQKVAPAACNIILLWLVHELPINLLNLQNRSVLHGLAEIQQICSADYSGRW